MWGYRSLGVCGKGASMSGLGKPPAGYGDLGGSRRAGYEALPVLNGENLSDMNYNSLGLPLMETT